MKEKERLNPYDDSQAGMWGHCALASQRPTESWWFQENSHHWSWVEDTTLALRNCRKQDILNSCLREVNYTFWQGLEPEEPGLHGVGFAIKNSLLESVEPRSNASGIPIQWPGSIPQPYLLHQSQKTGSMRSPTTPLKSFKARNIFTFLMTLMLK